MIADRVKETTTTTGTGNLTLAGAVSQFESFNTAFGTAAPFYYVITDANGTDWEVGTGELSNATTLVRTTVHQSSNADAKVNLSAGTHTVFCSAPAVFLSGLAPKLGKLSQFAATTSAELAGVVSDETGSGALVFATSPTLTTPNIGAATATSVNGTTIPSSKTLVATTDKLSALAATTSAELAGVISDETGTGALVFASSPSLTTPNIGAATATSVNGTTIPSSKTLVVTTDKLSALAATTSAELAGVISDETGSGSLVFATSPALTTPNIGTPSAGTLTNCTGLPVGGVSGLGTGVATALAVNTGSAGAVVVNGGALGTPSSGTLTNATGLPVSTGVSGLGTGVATALAVNTGSAGAVVVNGGALGTPSSGTLTNATGLPVSSGISGFGTGVATALAVNTGSSGAFVVNGGALGTPSSGTVTNLTGTASININGTVGATTPTTGAFTTVSASGVATFSAGTAAAPAITTSGDTNNGIYFPAADVTAITTAGSERMRVDASGNVGIGTSSLTNLLTVYSATSAGIDLLGDSGTGITVQRASTDASGPFTALRKTRGTIASPSAVATADILGTHFFSGFGGTNNRNLAYVRGGVEAYTSDTNIASYLSFATSPSGSVTATEKVRIDAAGNVGIGTSAPGVKLDVLHASGTGIVSSTTTATTASDSAQIRCVNGTVTSQFYAYSSSSVGAVGTNSNHAFVFTTNNTERMRINAAGELLIGTTTDNGAYLLQVNSQIFATNATIATSDARLKENVAPITNALETIGKVQAVAFDFKQGTEYNFDTVRQTGFIAQDLQVALADEDYKDSIVKECGPYLGVAYEKMVPVLVAAIQEQQQQIDALKAEVAALKGNA